MARKKLTEEELAKILETPSFYESKGKEFDSDSVNEYILRSQEESISDLDKFEESSNSNESKETNIQTLSNKILD